MILWNQQYYPDVFLAGAAKSGTTYLFDLLAAHSQIQGCHPKEPFFFIDKGNPYRQTTRGIFRREYLDFYKPLHEGCLHLDGTSQTIYQQELLSQFNDMPKKPKVLFILREPASRILSSFQYTSNNLAAVNRLSFSEYVDSLLEPNHRVIIDSCKNEKAAFSLTHELRYSCYISYLSLWERAVGKENMMVILFEEMKRNHELTLKEICEFLGIKAERLKEGSEKVNQSISVRNKSIHYILNKAFSMAGYRVPFKSSIKSLYIKLQHAPTTEDLDFQDDISRLKKFFVPFNQELATKFDLNLSIWN
ncbi:MAG: sulfotransferase [Roseivirga sp.]|jgi:hypothetical protein|uniref:sulfotransferase family protein n=1 Tax=Roseivirga sp. TaxID=1964215 RepID=UPI001B032E0E|nr:sulfotransferase [Roseivirga sp.]MBO6497571.1 sulfotransferase [Roseivirga sp.]